MITRSQKIRLGIFITAAMIILFGLVFVLTFKQFFKEKDIYYIAYEDLSVTGLDVGSSVKYLGINVGTVQKIHIDPENINRIIVTIGVEQGTPIKTDVRADIDVLGITGIKVIELRGGSNEAELLEPGGYLRAGSNLTEDITGKAEVIAEKVELVLNNLISLTQDFHQEKIFKLVDEGYAAVATLNRILNENQGKISHSFTNIDSSMLQLAMASRSAKFTLTSIEHFLASDSLHTTLDNIAQISTKLNEANIYNLDEDLNIAVDKMNSVLNQLDLVVKMNLMKLSQTMDQLNEATAHLRSAARQIDENPAILLSGSEPENPPDEKLER